MNLFITILYQCSLAILFTFIVQTFFYQPFKIPSSSMNPGLQILDYLIVNKMSYNYSNSSFSFMFNKIHFFNHYLSFSLPKRGDVIVFILPKNRNMHYIKRVIGLPGEELQVKNSFIYINKVPLTRVIKNTIYNNKHVKNVCQEFLPSGKSYIIYINKYKNNHINSFDCNNTSVYKVPKNHFFVLGDNRDNSIDSRFLNYVGYVSFHHIVGKAEFLFLTYDFSLLKFLNSFYTNRTLRCIE